MTEVWKPVVGYEDYYIVSNLGNVMSVPREVNGRQLKSRLMRQRHDKDGYMLVNLYKGNQLATHKVHRLVASAFLDGRSELQVNHKNGIKDDNRAENLEWVTKKQNMEHAVELGLMVRGEKHPNAKLTEGDVRSIRRLIDQGILPKSAIAAMYGVHVSTVHYIAVRRLWAWLDEKEAA